VKEAEIANARNDERFFRSRRCAGLGVPEADEQIGREPYDLPAHEQQKQAVGDDDAQHRTGEECQEAEEAREVFILRHVADAIDEDQQAHEGDHQKHHGGEWVEDPAKLQPLSAEL
jgi:hypothetical protein